MENSVILEVVILDIKPELLSKYEPAFEQAQEIISGRKGYISHQLQKCLEKPNRYILLVNWQTLTDHTVGFRESAEFQNGVKYCIISMIRFHKLSIMN